MKELCETLFPGQEAEIEALIKSHDWREYSALNKYIQEDSIASFWRITQGHNQRLFGIKTTNGNIFPICYLIPKGGHHSPDTYWKSIEPTLKMFLEFLEANPEIDVRKSPAKKSSSPQEVRASLRAPTQPNTPPDQFRELVSELSRSDPSDSQSTLEEMLRFIKDFETLVYNGDHFTFQSRNLSIDIAIKVNQAHLEILSGLASNGNINALTLLLSLSEAVNAHTFYINEHFDSQPVYLQSFMTKELTIAKDSVVARSWCLFKSSTIKKIMPWILESPVTFKNIFESEASDTIFKNIRHNKDYLEVFFKNCSWDQYLLLSPYLTHYNAQETDYLKRNIKSIRDDAETIDRIRPKLIPFFDQLPPNLCRVLGIGRELLPTSSRLPDKRVNTARAREKNYLNFTVEEWINCFQHGLNKEEFLKLNKKFGKRRFSFSHERSYLTAVLENVPQDLQRKALEALLTENVIHFSLNILSRNTVSLDCLQKFMSHAFHSDIMSIPEFKSGLARWMLTDNRCSIEAFNYLLCIYPDILQQPIGRLNTFRTLIDLTTDVAQRAPGSDVYELLSKKFQTSLAHYPAQPETVKDTQFLHVSLKYSGQVVARHITASNQAISEALFKEALILIKRVPPDQWQNVELWIQQEAVQVTPYEYLTLKGLGLTMAFSESMTKFLLNSPLNKKHALLQQKENAHCVISVNSEEEISLIEDIFGYAYTSSVLCGLLHLPNQRETIPELLEKLKNESLTESKIRQYLQLFIENRITNRTEATSHFMNFQTYKGFYDRLVKDNLPQLRDKLQEYHALERFFIAAGSKINKLKLSIIRLALSKKLLFTYAALVSRHTREQEQYIITSVLPRLYKDKVGYDYTYPLKTKYLDQIAQTDDTKTLLAEAQSITLLAIVAAANYFDATVTLLDKYSVPVLANKEGMTALHIAITQGIHRLGKLILTQDTRLTSLKGKYAGIAARWIIDHQDEIKVDRRHVQSMPRGEALQDCRKAIVRASIRCAQQGLDQAHKNG